MTWLRLKNEHLLLSSIFAALSSVVLWIGNSSKKKKGLHIYIFGLNCIQILAQKRITCMNKGYWPITRCIGLPESFTWSFICATDEARHFKNIHAISHSSTYISLHFETQSYTKQLGPAAVDLLSHDDDDDESVNKSATNLPDIQTGVSFKTPTKWEYSRESVTIITLLT